MAAAIVGVSGGMRSTFAACDNHNPTSGQTTICDTSPPNPDTQPIAADAGSTNVTVTLQPGAQLSVTNINGVLVRDQSQVTNAGSITVSGNTFDGIDVGSTNTVTNSGTITTSGAQGEGIFTAGNNNMLVNDTSGTITTTGDNSEGILVFGTGSGNTLINRGTITTSGPSADGIGAAGANNQLTNSGAINTTGASSDGLSGDGANNTITNTGTIVVSGTNAHGISSVAAGTASLGTVTNGGSVRATGTGGIGVFLGKATTFTNNAGGSVTSQQSSGVLANGGGTIRNAGTITGATGITVANGAGSITNDGTIQGTTGLAIVFGNFNNGLTNSGTINGTGAVAVQFGSGNDSMTMLGGTINAAVNQGTGLDSFTMSGGTLQSLNQGDSRDSFNMSGGRIVGAFDGGDDVTITGGRIGSIDLNVADNIMRMSGGQIDGGINAEQGADTLQFSNGSIGGLVDFGNGNNTLAISGGSIGNGIVTGTGTDRLTWSGGTIAGAIALGAGNDTAILRNLTSAILSGTTSLNGMAGADTLTFDNTAATGVGRFQNWESIRLTNGTQLTLDQNLVLGDSGTGTGALSIDGSSTLFAGGRSAAILALTGGQLVSVANGGTIDLTNGGGSVSDRLTIAGNYSAGSDLLLQSQLGGDGSPSDRLVISGGTATGSTGIGVFNVGGPGAATASDGILVVEAANGGGTGTSAFFLGGRVAAGAYEYLLFRGDLAGTAPDNWYLRSTLVPGSEPPAAPPPSPEPLAASSDGQTLPPPLSAAALPTPPPAGAEPVPLLRPEVPLYSAVPPMGRELALATLGTFHERQCTQSLLKGTGFATAGWGRLFGGHDDLRWSGTADPEFDGWIAGLQAGLDLYSTVSPRGDDRDRLGIFFGYARADGDIDGLAIGLRRRVGDLNLNAYSIGGYWTHLGAGDWYLDAVLMGTFFDGDASSDFGTGADMSGTGVTASLEGGYPIPLGSAIALEPQAQLIWQHADLDDTSDAFSTIEFDSSNAAVGRIGGRLLGDFQAESVLLQPYLKLNLWQNFGGSDDKVIFAGTDVVSTSQRSTAIEAGLGVVAQVTERIGLYAAADYTTDIAGNDTEIIQGNVGIRVTW